MKDEAQSTTGLSRRGALFAAVGAMAAPTLAKAAAGAASWPAVAAKAEALPAGKLSPGVQVAVMRKGAMIYSKGFGLANLETGTPVSPTSVFRIGSVTKQFTAAALLQLQEAGRLSVDDKLAKFLPEVPRANDITLRQMLTHTSGIGNYTDTGKVEIFLQRSRTDYDQAALLKAMLGTDPMFIGEPGAQWEYSNTAFVLLGIVIEKVTGKPYAETFKPNLFARAGLTRTAVDDDAEVVPGRASGYSPNPTSASGFENASYISMTYPGAAGSLRSTAEDLCHWHEALLGGRILSPASLKEMTTPAKLANGQQPTAPTAPGKDAPRRAVNYGMGLGLDTDAHGLQISHGGGIQGFGSWIGSYPDAGVHISFIVNADGGYDGKSNLGPATQALRGELLKAVFG
jgi:CubicO group peptidase (beta-lactamase class C family)